MAAESAPSKAAMSVGQMDDLKAVQTVAQMAATTVSMSAALTAG